MFLLKRLPFNYKHTSVYTIHYTSTEVICVHERLLYSWRFLWDVHVRFNWTFEVQVASIIVTFCKIWTNRGAGELWDKSDGFWRLKRNSGSGTVWCTVLVLVLTACASGIVCDAVATTGPPSINCCLLPSDHHHHQWPRIAKDHWSSHIIMITITPGSLVVCFTLIISDKSYDHHCSVHSWSQLISDHHLRQCEPPSVHQSIVISSYQSYQPTVCDNFQKRFGSKIFCIEFLKQEIGEIPSFTQLYFAHDNSNRSYMVNPDQTHGDRPGEK